MGLTIERGDRREESRAYIQIHLESTMILHRISEQWEERGEGKSTGKWV